MSDFLGQLDKSLGREWFASNILGEDGKHFTKNMRHGLDDPEDGTIWGTIYFGVGQFQVIFGSDFVRLGWFNTGAGSRAITLHLLASYDGEYKDGLWRVDLLLGDPESIDVVRDCVDYIFHHFKMGKYADILKLREKE